MKQVMKNFLENSCMFAVGVGLMTILIAFVEVQVILISVFLVSVSVVTLIQYFCEKKSGTGPK